MGDEEVFTELLNDYVQENHKDLGICRNLYESKSYKELGEYIHKLSSRFRTVGVAAPFDAKKIEVDFYPVMK